MNIHEAVLQPIAAFVYCNHQAAAGRQKSEMSTRQQAPEQLTPPMGGVSLFYILYSLFYDGTTALF